MTITADLAKMTMVLTTAQTKNIRSEELEGKKSLQKKNLQKSKCKSWLCLLVHPQELKK